MSITKQTEHVPFCFFDWSDLKLLSDQVLGMPSNLILRQMWLALKDGKNYLDLSEVFNHVKKHDGRKKKIMAYFFCPICKKQFNNLQEKTSHYFEEHNINIKNLPFSDVPKIITEFKNKNLHELGDSGYLTCKRQNQLESSSLK